VRSFSDLVISSDRPVICPRIHIKTDDGSLCFIRNDLLVHLDELKCDIHPRDSPRQTHPGLDNTIPERTVIE
jgi:hypothetical protein